jgi:hypothetical protein
VSLAEREKCSFCVYKNAMRVSVLYNNKKRWTWKHTVCIQMDFIFFAFPSHSFHYNLRYVNKICECQTNEVNDKNFQAVAMLLLCYPLPHHGNYGSVQFIINYCLSKEKRVGPGCDKLNALPETFPSSTKSLERFYVISIFCPSTFLRPH